MAIDTIIHHSSAAASAPVAPPSQQGRASTLAAPDAADGKPNPYAAIFFASMERGLAQSLREVRASEPLVPVPVRQQAWHLLSYALRLPDAWPRVRDLLLALAPKMEQEGLRDEWIPYLEGGVAQSRAIGDGGAEAELCFHLGYLWRLRGEFSRAAEWLAVSQRVFESRGDQNGQARAFNQMAYVARLQGQYEEARRYLYNAFQHLSEDDPELAVSHFVQGTIAFSEEKWEEAEQQHKASYAIWLQQGERRKLAWSAQNIGFALRGQGKYVEAIHFYEKAIQLLQETQDPVNQAIVQMNLGIVYAIQERPQQALHLWALSEETFQRVQDTWNLAKLYTNMSIEFRKLERWSEAEKVCRRGIQLFMQNGDLRWRINLLDGLGLIFLEQKLYDKAKETFEYAMSLLPGIKENPAYHSLQESLTQHLCQVEMERMRSSQ